jgi:hypothetical protein
MSTTLEILASKANTWDRVWNELKDHPLIKEVSAEHARDGNQSSASILLDAFNRAYDASIDE